MRKRLVALTVLSSVITFNAAIVFGDITVQTSTTAVPSDWFRVENIYTWATSGSLMEGMRVRATLEDNTVETFTWSGATGVAGSGWQLFMQSPSGNTYNSPFTLSVDDSTTLKYLFLDGLSGNTAFDVKPYGTPSTTGSFDGVPFRVVGDAMGLNIDALYTSPVALVGKNPIYDLYGNLLIDFTRMSGFSGRSLTFLSDTDNFKSVPEPATILMFGVGVTGLVAYRTRNRKKNL